MGQRHGEAKLGLTACTGTRPVQQYLGKAAGSRSGKRQTARIEKHLVIFASNRLRRMAANIAIVAQEFEEIAPSYTANLARLQSFRSHFVRQIVQRSRKSQH